MSADRPLEIVAFDFDVPSNYFAIPLEPGMDSASWAHGVVDEVVASVETPGERGDIVEELTELRRRLLATEDPWLTSLVSIRSEDQLSIGCLVSAEQFAMDADDGPDAFEAMLHEGTRQLGPGQRTRTAETWRSHSDIGDIVGMFHRYDVREVGEPEVRIEQRTIFGVFPDRSSDMIRLVFAVADLGTFQDMPRDTQAIVEKLRVRTEETA